MIFLTCFFQVLGTYHADSFQNGDIKSFQVATTPYPRTLTAYSTPVLGIPPIFFFIKITAKDVNEITSML